MKNIEGKDTQQSDRLKGILMKISDEIEYFEMEKNEQEKNQRILQKRSKALTLKVNKAKKKASVLESENRVIKNKHNSIIKSRVWRLLGILRFIRKLLKFENLTSKTTIIPKNNITKKQKSISVEKIQKNRRNDRELINRYKLKLFNLGFHNAAVKDIKDLVGNKKNPYRSRNAAWLLALWYAESESLNSELCLKYLEIAKKGETDKERLEHIAILEVECYQLLGEIGKGKHILLKHILESENINQNFILSMANLQTSVQGKLYWINKILEKNGLSRISIDNYSGKNTFDRLSAGKQTLENIEYKDNPKVTIIIPVYNSEKTIETTLESLLHQTWENMEIIIVDDYSDDNTRNIVKEYLEKDSRFQLIASDKNSGPYVARNIGLVNATGEFVTCLDADDWAHPQKIETQVLHLINNQSDIAVTTEHMRITNDLKIDRRGNPGFYIFKDMSSLMFRKDIVVEGVGYWVNLRFGGDSEFIRRIKKRFGNNSVKSLTTGPLSFVRKSDKSLTGNNYFGYPGYLMGARREFNEVVTHSHSNASRIYIDYIQNASSYPIPEPMLINRKLNKQRHFDVIIASDFGLSGGTTSSNAEEIKAQKRKGLKTGLIHMYRYDLKPRPVDNKIRNLIDGDLVQMLVYGESVTCDLLILRYPPILNEWQKFLPKVEAKNIKVIVNQTPKNEYGPNGRIVYDIQNVDRNIINIFGKSAIWHPIGPLVRDALYKYHSNDIYRINLSNEDWYNIIDVDEWKPSGDNINSSDSWVVGRHSRDSVDKWPNNRKDFLSIYPDKGDKVLVLGGGRSVKKILGYIPSNWEIIDFGKMNPVEFLQNINVFVYFTSSNLVEAFGRVIIEAMAAELPVILPHQYKKLFGEAAIYAEPNEVGDIINKLKNDPQFYQNQVKLSHSYIYERFSYRAHEKRIGEYIKSKVF